MHPFTIPEKAIQAFEALTDLHVVVHDLGDYLNAYLNPERFWHSQSACRSAKSGLNAKLCYRFEVKELRDKIGEYKAGRTHCCHAGLVEWMMPVTKDDQILAILFAGQARNDHSWTPEHVARRSSEPQPNGVQVVNGEKAEHILEALRQLALRLQEWIVDQRYLEVSQSRNSIIFNYIDANHFAEPNLLSLADQLGLSPSRTAHLVKEIWGFSFSEMVNQARLKTACSLLQHTDHTIQEIAFRSGFGDQSNFQKKFKAQFKLTPGSWRKLTLRDRLS